MRPSVPQDLMESLNRGECIAFIGAGWSMPTTPSWPQLLEVLAKAVPDGAKREELLGWLRRAEPKLSDRDYQGLGQAIYDSFGGDDEGAAFRRALARALSCKAVAPQTSARLRWLRGLPFHYVLTTNFDDLLGAGDERSAASYAKAITAERRPWHHPDLWDEVIGDGTTLWHDRVLHLHGRAGGAPVFSTRAYRKLLHEDAAYRGFLRTLFATHNVLYLGFSFSDAYISEVRSEILSMIGLDGHAHKRRDFAVLGDVPAVVAEHLRKYEGLEVLGYETRGESANHGGFDEWLEAIHEVANPEATLRRRIGQANVLWLDPNPRNNTRGHTTLSNCQITKAESLPEAVDALAAHNRASAGGGYDLVITHFGYRPDGPSTAERLLQEMHARRLYAPVIVFASGDHREENRRRSMRLGALAFADRWGELFGAVERALHDTGAES